MTREELLQSSDKQILDEVRRLQYLFGHSQIIRHGLDRATERFQTQSVSEHIYNMLTLAEYFQSLEDPQSEMDVRRIHQMILWHDAGELETGDVPKQHKTMQHDQEEARAVRSVIDKSPLGLPHLSSIIDEYESRQTRESQFVKAIDQLEVILNSYTEPGKKILQDVMHIDKDLYDFFRDTHSKHMVNFQAINKVAQIIMDQMSKEKYYND